MDFFELFDQLERRDTEAYARIRRQTAAPTMQVLVPAPRRTPEPYSPAPVAVPIRKA
jgi:hypothetical protein